MSKEYFIIEKENVDKLDKLVENFDLKIKSVCSNVNGDMKVENYFVESDNLDDVMIQIIEMLSDRMIDSELRKMLSLLGVTIDIMYRVDSSQWSWHNNEKIL